MIGAPPSPGPLIGVVSDDLTGAGGAAARLAARGLRAGVVWEPADRWLHYDAVVADTRGRDRPEGAVARTEAWGRAFREGGVSHVEMRVDTTLRGRPAEELAGFLRGLSIDRPVLVAVTAYPSAGRTTVDGVQFISDLEGRPETIEVGPVLFGSRPVCVVSHKTVTDGPAAIAEQVSANLATGVDAFVVDASEESDLRAAAAAVAQLTAVGHRLVSVSSGAWLRYHPHQLDAGYVLCVVASPTQTNRAQLEALAARGPQVRIASAADALVDPDRLLAEPARVLVIETISRDQPERPTQLAADATHRLLTRSREQAIRCGGLVVSGGRAAAAVVDRLEASAVEVTGEAESLCSFGYLVGGSFDGMCLITKGGRIGGEATLGELADAAARQRPLSG